MKLKQFQIDAFTDKQFGGNPAAVCFLENWLNDELLQKIAAENNLSETAFLVEVDGKYKLRWFTPSVEVDLCGHATLASAFLLFSYYGKKETELVFGTESGDLLVQKKGDLLHMNFPARRPLPIKNNFSLEKAFGTAPLEMYGSRDLIAVFENEQQIKNITPDLDLLKQIEEYFCITITAPGDTTDFVSRVFAPRAGIAEDPVTGSTHCSLIPLWADKLGKNELVAKQLSKRGGKLFCEAARERVIIGGNAVLYSESIIHI